MDERVPMTPRGYEALKQELHRLKTVERPANVKDIEEAIAHGDLSENAEYHAAKEKQAHIAGRIAMLDDKIARAQVIETSGQEADRVRFGATVVLSDVENEEEVSYTIVGEDEADAKQGLISVTSPVARALMSKEVGDEVSVKVPKGVRELEVLEIRFEL
ncbi:MAG: transcription elongation factor GreA [Deltaproteobacteria bacterium]|jgi:transcription elongation factor GreA|nr:transcription elongation factor GreA [Deltaproteobacteria bacterium]MBW2500514.1 transcription elongation factor GreA [Deltaproteobacteria bacterium]